MGSYDTTIRPSRMIGVSDVPEVTGFTGKFVYNFFTRDELYNTNGDGRFHGSLEVITKNGKPLIIDNFQKEVDASVLRSETPRFVELDWTPAQLYNEKNVSDVVLGEEGFIKKNKSNINDETTMNSPLDAPVLKTDFALRNRIVEKLKLSRNILSTDESPLSAQQILQVFADVPEVDSKIAESLLAKLSFTDKSFVNEIRKIDRDSTFSKAEKYKRKINVDRRVGSMTFNPIFDKNQSMAYIADLFFKDNHKNFALLRDEATSSNFELNLKVLPGKEKLQGSNNSGLDFKPTTAGYIIERLTADKDGVFTNRSKRNFYIDGKDNTKFIDTQVAYNRSYSYRISAVYLVQFIASVPDDPKTPENEAGKYRFTALVRSTNTKPVVIEAVENIPPAEPDGVLYRFNYEHGKGLLINWQMPVGKQRDIKYFQVFRRRTIKEPFTCIAELDFNDTITKKGNKKMPTIPRKEKIRGDRIYKFEFPRVFFNDVRFDRRSNFIYAIAAVDAHGLTSGYSAQVEVGFDRIKNVIKLKTISRAGAPKQYPNFFIDPDLDENISVDSLTADIMLSSKKESVHVFFDPDCRVAEINQDETSTVKQQAERTEVAKSFNKLGATYVLNMLNVDRQLARNFKIKLNNTRQKEDLVDGVGSATPN